MLDVKDKYRYTVRRLETNELALMWGVYRILPDGRTAVALCYQEDEARHICALLNVLDPTQKRQPRQERR